MKKISYFFISLTLLSILRFEAFAQDKKTANPTQNKKNNSNEVKNIEKIVEENSEVEEEIKPENDISRFNNMAVVQVLNKTTAKTSILNLKIGDNILINFLGTFGCCLFPNNNILFAAEILFG